MFVVLILLLIIATFLEGTMVALPLVLVCLLCFATVQKDASIFLLAFFAGLLLDILTLHPPGLSSLFFILILFLVFLYQRKYEINSYPFIILASFIGSWIFLSIFGYSNVIIRSGISAAFAVCLFGVLQFVTKRKK